MSFPLPCGKQADEVGKDPAGNWDSRRIYRHFDTCPECEKDQRALFKQFAEEIQKNNQRAQGIRKRFAGSGLL